MSASTNDTTSKDELRDKLESLFNEPIDDTSSPRTDAAMQLIKQYGDQIHNELTDNEKKVWLYKDDLERRLIQERIQALEELRNKHDENGQHYGNDIDDALYFYEDDLKKLAALKAKESK
ncbi:hypothetical protein QM806_04445 [Rhodococcus sp. IEGM 1351]|uniref:hypothetical protein n=1 Tax=Rhodococcus sp. IEGM 1351 TaxID=3047089 RepID=UPI0024B6E058|nr:hypothetical protein [Rhodococcus sp. IEGM 1351]MDI9934704.1 hypothetical protein [Rhodococcus sp. IEGM 1351]